MQILNKSLSLLLGFALASCVGIRGTRSTYGDAAQEGVTVNGAKVRLQVKPEGTRGGSYVLSAMVVGMAVANLDGPFRWRIEAEGEEGKVKALVVHRLRTKTSLTKRDEWYPASHLGRRAEFSRKAGEEGPVRAVYEITGLLQVKPKEDGVLEIFADLTVVGAGRSERKLVKFRLDPAEKKDSETIFLPAEIVSHIGKPPSEWEDKGWD